MGCLSAGVLGQAFLIAALAASPEPGEGGEGDADAGSFLTVVRGERPSIVELGEGELEEVPGTMGDPIRAVMSMPGVSAIHSGISYPIVRGSGPASTALFVDGVQVPLLFHLFVGPSVIHPDLIDSLELYPSSPAPEYGRLLGGVVEARTREPGERARVSAYADLMNTGVFASVWFPTSGTGFTFAFRYSFTAWLIAAAANALDLVRIPGQHAGETSTLDFTDYQLRLDQELGPGKLRFFLLGSADDYGVVSSQPRGGWMVHALFHRGDLRYRWPLGPGEAEVALTAGIDRLGYDGKNNSGTEQVDPFVTLSVITTSERVSEPSFRARASWRGRPSPGVELSFGADADHRVAELSAHQVLELDDIQRGAAEVGERDLRADAAVGTFLGAWAEVRWSGPGPWEVSSGLRADNYHLVPGIDRLSFEPRISARRRLAEGLEMRASAGAFHQPPVAVIGLPVVDVGGLRYGLQEGAQTDIGLSWRPWRGLEVTADAYFNPILTAIDLDIFQGGALGFQIAGPKSDALFPNIAASRSRGYATGLELMVRHPLGDRWFGWLTYSLQRSMRWMAYDLYEPDRGKVVGQTSGWVPFAFDQTHVANAVLGYTFPGGWQASVALHFNTGRPESGQLTSRTMVPGGTATWIPVEAPHLARLPPFFRADAHVSKTWSFGDFKLEASLDVLNATVSTEVVSYEYDSQSGALRRPIGVPLVLPVLGVKGRY